MTKATQETAKVSGAIVKEVGALIGKAEGTILESVKSLAKIATAENLTKRDLEASIKAGLGEYKGLSLKVSHAQDIQLIALLAGTQGAPNVLAEIATVAVALRKVYGTAEARSAIESNPKGEGFAVIAKRAKQALARKEAKSKAKQTGEGNKAGRKARPSEGVEDKSSKVEALPIDAQVIALAVALDGYAKAEGTMTANLRKALDRLEVALAEFGM